MATEHYRRLNDVLIRVSRSLLQYASSVLPRAGEDSAETRGRIDSLAARQRRHVAELVALLDSRSHDIDFGCFPDEFTDLNFVSLDFLLKKLAADHQALVAELEYQFADLDQADPADPAAAALLETLLADERDTLALLNSITFTGPQAAAGSLAAV